MTKILSSKNSEEERQRRVSGVFQDAAPRYDLMNDLMSFGLHRLWKRALIGALHLPKGDKDFRVLDAAAGSGDIGFGILEKAGSGARVLMMDQEPAMLNLALSRRQRWGARAGFLIADAREIPLGERLFDGFTIGFGIRNIAPRETAFLEAFRILRPGGRFLCLELSRPRHPWLRPFYDLYAREHLPRLGRLILGKAEPYRYLAESVRALPPAEEMARLMEEAGFSRIRFAPLSGGVATLYAGWRF